MNELTRSREKPRLIKGDDERLIETKDDRYQWNVLNGRDIWLDISFRQFQVERNYEPCDECFPELYLIQTLILDDINLYLTIA